MSYPQSDAYSRLLRGAHAAAATARAWSGPPRTPWQGTQDAGNEPEGRSVPLIWDPSSIRDIRKTHPLQPLLPLLAQTLSGLADETGHVMVVTDRDGRVLWREGNGTGKTRTDLTAADPWAGNDTGSPTAGDQRPGNGTSSSLTAGNGTSGSLAITGRPEQTIGARLHIWSGSAAPITDSDSGRVIGCVDVSGTARSPHPATVALVAAAAKLAETQLALRMHERDERLRRRYEALPGHPGILLSATGRVISGDPEGGLGERVPLGDRPAHLPGHHLTLRDGTSAVLEPFSDGYLLRPAPSTGPPVLTLSFLGEGTPSATYGDRTRPLSLRHAELLTLLALHPHGLTAEQLSFHLYGDLGNPVTIRAEIHRLRAQLGKAIAAKPYRLTCPVEADFLTLRHLLSANEPEAPARAYPGPLLPRSESPEIRRERDELEAQVRACVLRHGEPDGLWAYAQTCNGRDDYEVLERLAALPSTDLRSAAARTRLLT